MSYSGYNGLGCAGAGGCGCSGASGFGAYFTQYPRRGMRGFGLESATSDFNAAQVWADAVAGSPKEFGGAGDNAAGARATKAVQAGLNQLGFGPLQVNGSWNSATTAAWKSFRAKNGLGSGNGLIQQDGLVVMEEQLKKGIVSGSNTPISYVKDENGNYVPAESVTKPGAAPAKAGLSMGMMLLIGAVVVGGVVLIAKKKKDQQRSSVTSFRSSPMSGTSTSLAVR